MSHSAIYTYGGYSDFSHGYMHSLQFQCEKGNVKKRKYRGGGKFTNYFAQSVHSSEWAFYHKCPRNEKILWSLVVSIENLGVLLLGKKLFTGKLTAA